MNRCRTHAMGFTLIELMLIVAIIGLLAVIALPKFSNLVVRAKEAAVKGKLGSLRSALSIYYADTEGISFCFRTGLTLGGAHVYPLSLITPKYIEKIPKISVPHQHYTTASQRMESDGCLDMFDPGQWGGFNSIDWPGYSWEGSFRYFMPPGSNIVYVNSGYLDSSGRVWSTW